jgi:hypothetical protein
MKLAFLSLIYLLTNTLTTNGQLAIIKDSDGFTNVHVSGSANAKIIGKFHDGDVFGYGEETNGWINVVYLPADSSESRYLEGYIYKDRLLPLEQLPHMPENCKTVSNGHHLTLRNDSLTVELITAPFEPKNHTLRKNEDGLIEKIDGKRPLGTDGEMPLEKLTGLRMTIRGKKADIPVAALDNLYDPTLETCNVFVDKRTGFMYIYLMSGRSAAGGYELVWVFKNGRYVRRYVDQSNN